MSAGADWAPIRRAIVAPVAMRATWSLALLFAWWAVASAAAAQTRVSIVDPPAGAIYPPDMMPPLFVWRDPSAAVRWSIEIAFGEATAPLRVWAKGEPLRLGRIDPRCLGPTNEPPSLSPEDAASHTWRPPENVWSAVRRRAVERSAVVTIRGFSARGELLSSGATDLRIARYPVGAPIFYRDVPLMPSELEPGSIKPLAPEALPLIGWRLRDVGSPRSRLLLEGMPTCANCHSFSLDGKTIGIDLDGPANDRGAYALAPIQPRLTLRDENVITWNSFLGKRRGEKTIGFMSQVSPDGRYVVSTVNESIYVANFKDYRFLQVFYPTRGILAWYDRQTRRMGALPGADDPRYVQTNAVWSPDGKYLVFARAPAGGPYPEGHALPQSAGDPNELPVRYDLYRIPFNGGRGGVPEPILGASANGMSNSFPKVSPDGRWIVFVQARNALLMRPDGQLYIVPFAGGVARRMRCNTPRMNSWHSFSPNGRWLVFSSKSRSPYTQMFLTYLDDEGNDSPAILVENATAANRAVNLPEFVNLPPDGLRSIEVPAAEFFRIMNRARELDAKGRLEAAMDEWNKALRLSPNDSRARNGLGMTLAHAGKIAEAAAQFERAIAADPENADAWNNLGVLLVRLGKDEEAMRHYQRAIATRPNFAQAHYNLGRLLLRAGRVQETIVHWRRAATLSPQTAEVSNNLATVLAGVGNLEEAINYWRRALRADAGLKEAHLGLGSALFRQGRLAEALMHWRKGLAIEPPAIEALNQAARVLATHPDAALRNGPEAVEYATRAVAATKAADAVLLDTLAAAYAEAGRYPEAIETVRRAMAVAAGPLAEELPGRLALYQSGRPLREEVKLSSLP